jgi:hypothetical protein
LRLHSIPLVLWTQSHIKSSFGNSLLCTSTINPSGFLRSNTDTCRTHSHPLLDQPPSTMNATTREGSARVTRAQLRDLQQEITTFTNQSSSASGLSNKSGHQATKADDDGDQGDWLEMLESRIAHLESVVASICHQAHDCSVYAKAENIERWLSTMIGAHTPKADKPLSGTRLAR